MYKRDSLKVNMLGDFLLEYGGRRLVFERNTATRSNQLLQMLLQAGGKGVPRETMMKKLFGAERITNPAGSLRTTIFRLRKAFVKAGLPEYAYVTSLQGIFYWSEEIPAKVDTQEFENLIWEAEHAKSQEEEKEAYLQAVRLYRGEFLPSLGAQEWVNVLSSQYRKMYFDAMMRLIEILQTQREYALILELCTAAARIYPYDEWELQQMDALIAMNRYKEAMKIYQNTARMFFAELGIAPSEKMMQRFEKMSSHIQLEEGNFREIKETLVEEDELDGAYFCSYPSFKESYRFIRRLIERTGQSAYLVACTIVDGKGTPLRKGKKLDGLSKELREAVRRALRRGDLYTQYSPSQFVMLLMEIRQEECSIAMARIDRTFCGGEQSAKRHLQYQIAPVSEVSDTRKIFHDE